MRKDGLNANDGGLGAGVDGRRHAWKNLFLCRKYWFSFKSKLSNSNSNNLPKGYYVLKRLHKFFFSPYDNCMTFTTQIRDGLRVRKVKQLVKVTKMGSGRHTGLQLSHSKRHALNCARERCLLHTRRLGEEKRGSFPLWT